MKDHLQVTISSRAIWTGRLLMSRSMGILPIDQRTQRPNRSLKIQAFMIMSNQSTRKRETSSSESNKSRSKQSAFKTMLNLTNNKASITKLSLTQLPSKKERMTASKSEEKDFRAGRTPLLLQKALRRSFLYFVSRSSLTSHSEIWRFGLKVALKVINSTKF
jgi:hypothetical protein